MGMLISVFLLIYYIVSVFSGNADTGVLIAAGLFMVASMISLGATGIEDAIKENKDGSNAGKIIGSMMRAFNGVVDKKDDAGTRE